MEPDKTYWDQIDDYLCGRLSPEGEEAMENAMQQDPALEEEVRQQEKIVKGLRQLRLEALTRQAEQWEAEIREEEKQPEAAPEIAPTKKGKVVPMRRWAWAAAAVLAVLVIAAIALNRQWEKKGSTLAVNIFTPPEMQLDKGDSELSYQNGIEAFDAKDYADAISNFNQVGSSDSKYASAQFLLGISYFMTKDYPAARMHFESAKQRVEEIEFLIGKSPDGKVVTTKHIDWYLALANFAAGQRRAGQRILDQILADSEHPFLSEAQALEKELK